MRAAAFIIALLCSEPVLAEKMTGFADGCVKFEDLLLVGILGENDKELAREKIKSGACTRLFEGEPVRIIDRKDGFVQIETPEDGAKYWVLDHYVGK